MKALENVMRYADTTGDSYGDAVNKLLANPTLAQGFFDLAGTKTGAARKIALTPADALVVELQQSLLDYLDVKASKSEAQDYAKKINELEKKRKGPLTQLERQQLLLDTVQESKWPFSLVWKYFPRIASIPVLLCIFIIFQREIITNQL